MIEKSVGEPLRGLVILLILKRKLWISVGTWMFGYRMHLEKVNLSLPITSVFNLTCAFTFHLIPVLFKTRDCLFV